MDVFFNVVNGDQYTKLHYLRAYDIDDFAVC